VETPLVTNDETVPGDSTVAGSGADGEVLIRFCFSCGYKQAFAELSRRLQQAYPNLKVTGENYPPPPLNASLATMCQLLFFAALAANLAGSWFLPPAAAQWVQDNRMASIAIVFMANMMAGNLMNTGAFEVSYNGRPVFSKLEAGQMAEYPALMELVRRAVEAKP